MWCNLCNRISTTRLTGDHGNIHTRKSIKCITVRPMSFSFSFVGDDISPDDEDEKVIQTDQRIAISVPTLLLVQAHSFAELVSLQFSGVQVLPVNCVPRQRRTIRRPNITRSCHQSHRKYLTACNMCPQALCLRQAALRWYQY